MDIKEFSKKPKLSTFSETIFSIGDDGDITLGGKVFPFYKCTLLSTYSGLGYQLFYNEDNICGYLDSEIDVFTTINNHQKYLEKKQHHIDEMSELVSELCELEHQKDGGSSDEYYNSIGEPIQYEELCSSISELEYWEKQYQNNLNELENINISDWNC
jgi:hypothetical protein